MIFPVGPEDSDLRSAPYITFTLLGICLIVFLVGSWINSSVRVRSAYEEAIEYYGSHRYLDIPLGLSLFMAEKGLDPAKTISQDDREQEKPNSFDLLMEQQDNLIAMVELADQKKIVSYVYFHKWGFAPGDSPPISWITHLFVHMNLLHFLVNMLILYVAGTVVEDRLGQIVYPVFFLFCGLATAAVFGLQYPEHGLAWIGCGGATAGILGAFLFNFWKKRIRIALLLGKFSDTYPVPAWTLLPLWLLAHGLMFLTMKRLSANLAGTATAVLPLVFGLGLGGLIAFLLAVTGIEKKLYPEIIDPEAEKDHLSREALKQEGLGNPAVALEVWRVAAREQPENLAVLQNYWRVALSIKRPADVTQAGLKLLRLNVGANDTKMAYMRFGEILNVVPEAKLPVSVTNRLAEVLIADQFYLEAEEVLTKSFRLADKPTVNHLIHMLELTIEMKNELGLEVVAAAQANSECSEMERARLKELAEELAEALGLQGGLQGGLEISEADPLPFTEGLEKKVHSLKVVSVRPLALAPREMTVALGSEKQRSIAYNMIKVIGVGLIREADQKPRLLIDLMFDPIQAVLPQHRIMRFSSADFDIRGLLPKAIDAHTAYAQMLAGLLDRSGAVPLPERNAVLGKPYAIFDSVRTFERTTYFPA